ncbi:MAG: DUF4349 domain-containing protein [Myxococcales bacterium]|nr:DUF4349 domain-containing protein [Myxococcales bacterium]
MVGLRFLGGAVGLLLAGCSSPPDAAGDEEFATSARVSGMRAESMAAAPPAPQAAPTRALVWTAWQTVEVEDPEASARAVEALASSSGGYAEDASREFEGASSVRVRVPTGQLESVLDQIAALGEEKERRTSARDVTEQLADLEATLASKRKLRDRLRALLDRADKVKDLLELERELARVQSDIDRMEGRQKRLQGQVDLATVHVTLTPESKRILGPLGYVAYGIGWFVKKLFIISP